MKELFYRSFYSLISVFFCFLISLQNIELLLLIETYPFLKFANKKFIVTHTTDLINAAWNIATAMSYFLTFPLFVYQLIQFFKPSWYKYQITFAKKLFIIPLVISYIFILLCYYKIFPSVLNFLTQWNFSQLKLILNVEIEFRIINYLIWILTLRNCFWFLSYFFVMLIILFLFFIFVKNIYNLIKFQRKNLCFLNIVVLLVLTPPDIFLQFFIIFSSFIFYETIFCIICYKICNSKLKI